MSFAIKTVFPNLSNKAISCQAIVDDYRPS